MNIQPPKVARTFLHWYCDEELVEEIEGDLNEEFTERLNKEGKWKAVIFYVSEVIRSYNSANRKQPNYSTNKFFQMKHNIKIAYRNLIKNNLTSFINIIGLALSLTVVMFAVIYITDELSFNNFHKNLHAIYRVGIDIKPSDEIVKISRTPHPLGLTMAEEIPEIESVARIKGARVVISKDELIFREEQFYYADETFLQIFTYPLASGNKQNALVKPFSIILTKPMKQKYFGDEMEVLGKSVTVKDVGEFIVTSILDEIPANSHLEFDFLASYSTLNQINPNQIQAWDNLVTTTFIQLKNRDENINQLILKINNTIKKHIPDDDFFQGINLFPFKDIYLHSKVNGEIGKLSDFKYIYIFSGVALFILVIASINFINLNTAQSTSRSREIGTRKVLGAHKNQIISQFITESVLLTVIAFIIAGLATVILLPYFNLIAGKNILPVSIFASPGIVSGLSLLVLFIGVISGIYPAFIISSLSPVSSLKSQAPVNFKPSKFGKSLTVLQFILAVVLMIGSSVMYQQMTFLQSKDLGFDKQHLMVVSLRDKSAVKSREVLKNEFIKLPEVSNLAASYHTPGVGLGTYYVKVNDSEDWRDMATYIVDEDFIKTMNIKIVLGNTFSADDVASLQHGFLINESAVKELNIENPLGAKINWDNEKTGEVIGIVRDFHVRSLYHKIPPLLIFYEPDYFRYLTIRLNGPDLNSAIGKIESKFKQIVPDAPFEYSFVDENFDNHYQAANSLDLLTKSAAITAIAVALIGLFGMLHFNLTSKRKEYGIRKVYGASVYELIRLSMSQIILLVLISLIIAIPVSGYLLGIWLSEFAYHINQGIDSYIFPGVTVLILAGIITCYQTIKVGFTNLNNTLRHE